MVRCIINPATWEPEAGGSPEPRIPRQSGQDRETRLKIKERERESSPYLNILIKQYLFFSGTGV
jgi:hypothetical protein